MLGCAGLQFLEPKGGMSPLEDKKMSPVSW